MKFLLIMKIDLFKVAWGMRGGERRAVKTKILVMMLCVGLGGCGKNEAPTNDSDSGSKIQTGETKTCFWCKESVKVAALICKHCGKNPSNPNTFVGEYEIRKDNHSFKIALLDGGLVEAWEDEVKTDERGFWVLKNKQIETTDARGKTIIFKIATNAT